MVTKVIRIKCRKGKKGEKRKSEVRTGKREEYIRHKQHATIVNIFPLSQNKPTLCNPIKMKSSYPEPSSKMYNFVA